MMKKGRNAAQKQARIRKKTAATAKTRARQMRGKNMSNTATAIKTIVRKKLAGK